MKKQLRSWKNAKELLNVRTKESSIEHVSKDFYKENGVSKTCKSVRKTSKTQICDEFN